MTHESTNSLYAWSCAWLGAYPKSITIENRDVDSHVQRHRYSFCTTFEDISGSAHVKFKRSCKVLAPACKVIVLV